MSFLYDREKLLTLFDSVYDVDPEVNIVRYSLSLEDGQVFTLFLSPFDARASVTLMRKDQKSWVFDIGVEKVCSIFQGKNELKIYKDDDEEHVALTVVLHPYLSVQCDAK